jgi:S1-C subfamily serine protease
MSSLNPMGVDEALRLIDAEASFENNAWVVKSVRAKGIADQMGLKAGDTLKAIDGKPIGEKTEFQRSFSAGTIQVQRGDATVELGSANKMN